MPEPLQEILKAVQRAGAEDVRRKLAAAVYGLLGLAGIDFVE